MSFLALDRLRTVPWEALAGLDAATPLGLVLSGQAAERVIDRTLRAQPQLTAAQRTALVEAIFGVSLWRRRIAAQLGAAQLGAAHPGAAQLDSAHLDQGYPPELLLFGLLRDLAGLDEVEAARLAGARGGGPLPEPTSLAERFSFPDWIAQVLEHGRAPEEAQALAAALCAPGPIFLRANTLRISRDSLARLLRAQGISTVPCAFASAGLRVTSRRPNLLAQAAGLFEVQDEGSQLLGELLEARPGETLLDLCAGAGGKTLQLAALLEDRGRIVACDPDLERLARLERRARKAGATCIEVGEARPCQRVLVDAPCSELGILRRGPDARWRRDLAQVAHFPALQRALLETALANVLPGGLLVYATCTLRDEENRGVALPFEREHPRLVRLAPRADRSLLAQDGFFESFPHRHGTDGFFAAVWQC